MEYRIFLFILLFAIPQTRTYSRQQNAAVLTQQVKDLQFIPEMVYPMGMRPRQTTAEFVLRLKPDTLFCYLPYFGRASGVDYGSGKSSTDFTSFVFDYQESEGKKGEKMITIRPKDNREVRSIAITYTPGGDYAYVTLTFNRQQSISYRGRLISSIGEGQ